MSGWLWPKEKSAATLQPQYQFQRRHLREQVRILEGTETATSFSSGLGATSISGVQLVGQFEISD
jgi:cystathionine beta-lyase/cystathionine gamma-synthase